MNARWLSVGLTVAMCGCSSGQKDPAPQPAAAEAEAKAGCVCPEGQCACPECKAGDTAGCSCAAK